MLVICGWGGLAANPTSKWKPGLGMVRKMKISLDLQPFNRLNQASAPFGRHTEALSAISGNPKTRRGAGFKFLKAKIFSRRNPFFGRAERRCKLCMGVSLLKKTVSRNDGGFWVQVVLFYLPSLETVFFSHFSLEILPT
jgi:hypothetical protein